LKNDNLNQSQLKRPFLFIAFLLVVLGAAFTARFLHIHADPPAGEISRSGAFLTDEGIYGYNALQWARTGEWYVQGELNPGGVLSVFMTFQFGLLKIFGIHLWSVRLGGILCGLGFLSVLFFLLRKENCLLAKIVLLFGALNFPLLIYNRIAIAENLLLCILILLLFCLRNLGNPKNNVFWTMLFWIFMALGFLTKSIHIFFIIPFVVEVLRLDRLQRKKVALTSLGCITILGLGLFFYASRYAEEWHYFYQLNIFGNLSSGLNSYFRKILLSIGEMPLFAFMPISFTLALIMSIQISRRIVNKKPIDFLHRVSFSWFASGLLFLIFLPYSPPRYWLILIPPILILSGLFVTKCFVDKEFLQSERDWRHIFIPPEAGKHSRKLAGSFVLPILLLQITAGLYRYFILDSRLMSCFFPLLSLIPIWFLFSRRFQTRNIVLGLVGIIVIFHSFQIIRYHTKPQYSFINMIRDVREILESDSRRNSKYIAGDMVSIVEFESDIQSIDVMYKINQLPNRLKKSKPGFLLLEDPNLLQRFDGLMPHPIEIIIPVKEYRLMENYHRGCNAVLYQINWQ